MNGKINNTKKALENMQLKVIEVTKTNNQHCSHWKQYQRETSSMRER